MSFLLIDTKLICMCTGPPAWLFHIYFAFLKSFVTCILILHLSLRKQTRYLFSRSSRNEIILKEFITFPKRDQAFIMFLNSFRITFFISWLHQGVNVSFSEKFANVPNEWFQIIFTNTRSHQCFKLFSRWFKNFSSLWMSSGTYFSIYKQLQVDRWQC